MEKIRKLYTLVLIHDHPRILLGKKKRGFGVGKWNGFGGKVELGEDIEDAAKRELFEESGLKTSYLEKVGINEFEWKNGNEILEVHVFKTNYVFGDLKESDEMSPKWFFVDEIPFVQMWPDDKYWFPYFLRDKKFKGKFIFGEKDVVLDYSLGEVENL